MTNKLIDEIRNNLDNGSVTSEMLFEEATSRAREYQDEYNSFITIMDKKEEIEGDSILRGIPYALKDNISTRGILTTASSNILKELSGLESLIHIISRFLYVWFITLSKHFGKYFSTLYTGIIILINGSLSI